MSGQLLIVSEDGFGKRTPVERFSPTGRNSKGVIAMPGPSPVVAAFIVTDGTQLLLSTTAGHILRLGLDEIPVRERRSRGSRLVALDPGERVSAVAQIPPEIAHRGDLTASEAPSRVMGGRGES